MSESPESQQQWTAVDRYFAEALVPALDQILAGEGYPDKSTILVVGPPGIGKEALGYWFTQSGLGGSDFCLYVTRLSVKEVLQDEKGFGIDTQQNQRRLVVHPKSWAVVEHFLQGKIGGLALPAFDLE